MFHIYIVYTYLLHIFVNSRKLTNRETCMENAYFNFDYTTGTKALGISINRIGSIFKS